MNVKSDHRSEFSNLSIKQERGNNLHFMKNASYTPRGWHIINAIFLVELNVLLNPTF